MKSKSDSLLISLYQKGDEGALSTLIHRHQRELFTFIFYKINDEDLANDVFQVIAFAESQPLAKENTKENLLQKLDDIYSRVRGISRENNSIDTGINLGTVDLKS